VFILYGLVAGLAIGLLTGGRIERLGTMRFRFGAVVIAALAVQVALFSPLADVLPNAVARGAYVASTAAVALVVLANLRLAGMALVALGAGLNIAAILANGGAMPASADALATAGIVVGDHTNSVVVPDPVLAPLIDVFALPAWLPLANVFSIGDVLIGAGLALAVAVAIRATPSEVRR
jgi:hypothetical protein